jgi:hypothetical protein
LEGTTRSAVTRRLGVAFGLFTGAVFLPVQVVTGIALAAHRGMTVARLTDTGYGHILGAKLVLFAAVLALSAGHGMAVGRGRDRLARLLALATLLGSVGVIWLATALVP